MEEHLPRRPDEAGRPGVEALLRAHGNVIIQVKTRLVVAKERGFHEAVVCAKGTHFRLGRRVAEVHAGREVSHKVAAVRVMPQGKRSGRCQARRSARKTVTSAAHRGGKTRGT